MTHHNHIDGDAMLAQNPHGPRFIGAHQAAIASHVGRHYCCELVALRVSLANCTSSLGGRELIAA
jgi:hypothetical protein